MDPIHRLRRSFVAASVVSFVAALCGVARAAAVPSPAVTKAAGTAAAGGKRCHDGFLLRLSLGAVALYESWSPSGSGAGAVFSGGGTSLETAVGKSLRPGLFVGGLWQLVAVTDPNESYRGTTYVVSGTDRFVNVMAAFVDYYPNPRRGLHVGGSAGLLVTSNLDRAYWNVSTDVGAAIAVRAGYEVFFSSRWSVGAFAQLQGYRYSSSEANVSSTSSGLLPALALAFTFD
jgi:hypothetical protein